jgi:hypothetical protein
LGRSLRHFHKNVLLSAPGWLLTTFIRPSLWSKRFPKENQGWNILGALGVLFSKSRSQICPYWSIKRNVGNSTRIKSF